ncbi:GL15430 [Drosophila persimilis]|uniref:GL15430 n=1 Tax=Drosophila persimilis TaxID=7234 RepID=B4GPV3_DROPE|nr:GL15430 [Drosophila persimilis]
MAKLSRRASSSAATPSTAKTATDTATAPPPPHPSHATGLPQRITRRATSNHNNNNNRPRAAALIDTSADVLQETPSPSPTPPTHTNSNNNTATRNESTAAPAPAHNTATPYMPLLPPGERNLTDAENAAERARIREEFFATYDVMTGVRIAATLGGFFGLMVFLIVWKSRSSSNETLKVLKDPKMAAVASLCMQEEEEREIQEAIVATGMSIYPDEYDAMVYRRQRMLSLGNVSAPPLLNRGYRCGSVGGVGAGVPMGYSYLLEPPRRFSYSAMSAGGGPPGPIGRRKSGSESSRIFSNYPMGGSFGTDDYFVETEDELEHEEYMQRDARDEPEHPHHQRTDSTRSKQGFLSVPMAGHDSRRSSAMTCCSTDSSYLERRTSAYTLGMSNLPPTLQRKLIDGIAHIKYRELGLLLPGHPGDTAHAEGFPVSVGAQHSRSLDIDAAAELVPDAQAGRKQQIHSISADTVDVYPYNQTALADTVELGLPLPKPIQSAPPTSAHQAFHFCDSPSEELRLGVRRKLTLVELQRNESNNNSFPYTANAAAPASTVSAKVPLNVNGNPEKRAPLASLSSFKISSLECPDSELRSLEEDSVFGLESPADTDDDMQQLSSDSEEQAVAMAVIEAAAAAAAKSAAAQGQGTSVQASGDLKPNPLPQVIALKRMSLSGVATAGGGGTGARPRRPLLQRHRTISTASSDRVSLIGPHSGQSLPLQQFQGHVLPVTAEAVPLETHFGAIVSHSPPRRGPLLQQYSDPQSLPTTTTTTTTTTTEDDTCSTLNTELRLLDAWPGGGGTGGGESNTHTQYSSMNTVISVGRSTPSPGHSPSASASATTSPRMDNNYACSQAREAPALQPAQLPLNSRLVHDHDPCPSSKSDSVIATRPQSICVPSSLKDLILRKGTATAGISKSATNLSLPSNEVGARATTTSTTTATPAVMLELPLIRLPNDDENENENDNEDVDDDNVEAGEDKRDPSLPGTSRKWSKETLF